MVYLRLHDTNSWPEPDSRDDQLIHEFMVQKYENKRFFVEPTDVMRQDARRLSENVFNAQLQPKHPLRSTLGGNALRLTVRIQTHTSMYVYIVCYVEGVYGSYYGNAVWTLVSSRN